MSIIEKSCVDFVNVLATKEPVPGGGGASALVGAIGTALGNMVGSLTVGKKKYVAVEAEMQELKEKCDQLQSELLALVEKDAEVFAPLAKAYGMPKDTEEERAEKERVMEAALKAACDVPLQIMKKCCAAIGMMSDFAQKGSRLAVSDAGVGVTMCRAALEGAALNVFINTKAMTDRAYAAEINLKTERMLSTYRVLAEEIYNDILKGLRSH